MRKATLLLVLLLVLVPLLVISCSGKTATKKVDNPNVLYVEGIELMKKKKWDQARSRFSQVRENYPFDPMADIATVKLGDVYFEQKEYLLAAGVYTDFINSHPDDENAPYVLWRLGESFEKLSLTIDRDQAYTLKAIERLTYLQNRYPENQYARDATERLKRLTQRLADRELYVGDYYYRTGNYNAATIRLEYFLSKYPGAAGTDKALFILSAAYKQLADAEKAQYYTEKLRKEYPSSAILKSKAGASPSKTSRADQTPDANQRTAWRSPAPATPAPADVRVTQGEAVPDADSGKGQGGRVPGRKEMVDKKEAVAPLGDKEDGEPALALRLTEDEKKPRQIVLRPTAMATNPAEAEKQTASDAQPVMQSGQQTAQEPGQEQGTKSQTGREPSTKPAEKGNTFGFFTSKKPVDIVADTMEGLEKGKIIIFKGNVVTKQDDLKILSDNLTAYVNEESNEVEKADASGNVKIIKAERTATCDQALFENAKGEITLKGNVVVYSGQDRLSGDTVIYYINEERVTVAGEKEKRARVTVQPK